MAVHHCCRVDYGALDFGRDACVFCLLASPEKEKMILIGAVQLNVTESAAIDDDLFLSPCRDFDCVFSLGFGFEIVSVGVVVIVTVACRPFDDPGDHENGADSDRAKESEIANATFLGHEIENGAGGD